MSKNITPSSSFTSIQFDKLKEKFNVTYITYVLNCCTRNRVIWAHRKLINMK